MTSNQLTDKLIDLMFDVFEFPVRAPLKWLDYVV